MPCLLEKGELKILQIVIDKTIDTNDTLNDSTRPKEILFRAFSSQRLKEKSSSVWGRSILDPCTRWLINCYLWNNYLKVYFLLNINMNRKMEIFFLKLSPTRIRLLPKYPHFRMISKSLRHKSF